MRLILASADIDATDYPVVTVVIVTPVGNAKVMAEVSERTDRSGRRDLVAHGVHIDGPGANMIGVRAITAFVQEVMEGFNYDGLVIEGEVRTTGANPGRRPGQLRFARRRRDH